MPFVFMTMLFPCTWNVCNLKFPQGKIIPVLKTLRIWNLYTIMNYISLPSLTPENSYRNLLQQVFLLLSLQRDCCHPSTDTAFIKGITHNHSCEITLPGFNAWSSLTFHYHLTSLVILDSSNASFTWNLGWYITNFFFLCMQLIGTPYLLVLDSF